MGRSISAVAVLATVLLCLAARTAIADPTYCLEHQETTTECNCHPCNCQVCHTCGCETKTLFWNTCDFDSCGDQGCWCSPACRCCYTSSCRTECNCETCCETCVETTCKHLVTYSVHSVFPASVDASTPGAVTVTGGYFVATEGLRCRFGDEVVAGELLSNNEVRCSPPNVTLAEGDTKPVFVSVSLDGGTQWTVNNVTLTYTKCPNHCSGNGTCDSHSVCVCNDGFTGADCSVACPKGGDGATCSGRGECTPTGGCQCHDGFWGTACEGTCPIGLSGAVCSGPARGVCSATTGACLCHSGFIGGQCEHTGTCTGAGTNCTCEEKGYWGPGCSATCPGSSHCTAGVGCTETCNGHGLCARDGKCVCSAGYYGNDCASACPSSNEQPCSGHTASGTCDSEGTCLCASGWSGLDCGTECPGGSASPCNDHGTCTQHGTCVCEPGYAGSSCQLQCPVSGGQTCSGRGACTDAGTCECNQGYSGSACESTCPGGAANPCSGHGSCRGQCFCEYGYYGTECASECPGGVATPCNNNGHCNGETGACNCNPGFFGSDCASTCPMYSGLPCGGSVRGSCGVNGVCTCNPPYGGTACETVSCQSDCYGHGTCDAAGVCHCSAGWTGIYCSTQTTVNPLQGGHAQFTFQPRHYNVLEDSGTITLNVSRGGSNFGEVYVWYRTEDVSAHAGADYVATSGKLVWPSGDSSLRQIHVTVVGDDDPEGTEVFVVNLYDASPGSLIMANGTVAISGNDNADSARESASVLVSILKPADDLMLDTVAGAKFATDFASDLCGPNVLHIGTERLVVRTVESNGADKSLYTFVILGSGTGPGVSDLTLAFLSQMSDPHSALWLGTASRFLDIQFEPVVRFSVAPPVDEPTTYWWLLGLLITLAVLGACAGVGYKKRHQLTEWLLWRLGNFRFHSLMKHRNLDLDGDTGDPGAGVGDAQL